MKKIGRTLLKIIEEVPAIVVAVFLALVVNDCNENRKEYHLATSSLQALQSELVKNQQALAQNLTANELEAKEMRADLDSLRMFGLDSMSTLSVGISQAMLQKSAWDMAILSGSTRNFRPGLLNDLTTIYGLQELYDEMAVNYFKELSTIEFYKPGQEKERIQASLQVHQLTHDISNQLSKLYDKIIPELTTDLKK